MERAKELFLKYNGNRFYMDREGEGGEYESYHVSKETEEMWAKEAVSSFLESKPQGRKALCAYISASELAKSGGDWDRCLYYPLQSEQLDDVTVLFMLPHSFRMAERAVKKQSFSKEEADTYFRELDRYLREAGERSESVPGV